MVVKNWGEAGLPTRNHFALKSTLQLLEVSGWGDVDAGVNVAPAAVGVTVKLEPPGIVQLQRCAACQVAQCLLEPPNDAIPSARGEHHAIKHAFVQLSAC